MLFFQEEKEFLRVRVNEHWLSDVEKLALYLCDFSYRISFWYFCFQKPPVWYLALYTRNAVTFPEICLFNLQQSIIFAANNRSYLKRLRVVEEKDLYLIKLSNIYIWLKDDLLNFLKSLTLYGITFQKYGLAHREKIYRNFSANHQLHIGIQMPDMLSNVKRKKEISQFPQDF